MARETMNAYETKWQPSGSPGKVAINTLDTDHLTNLKQWLLDNAERVQDETKQALAIEFANTAKRNPKYLNPAKLRNLSGKFDEILSYGDFPVSWLRRTPLFKEVGKEIETRKIADRELAKMERILYGSPDHPTASRMHRVTDKECHDSMVQSLRKLRHHYEVSARFPQNSAVGEVYDGMVRDIDNLLSENGHV